MKRLTAAQRREVARRRAGGERAVDLALEFGVTDRTIRTYTVPWRVRVSGEYLALGRTIVTAIGHFPAGIPVVVVKSDPYGATTTVCLDHPEHLGARCHAVTVPCDWLV